MQIFGIVSDSIVDGPGWRTAIFCQGCFHDCPGCHNPGSHDPAGGQSMTVREVVSLFHPFCDGITLTGGEPFEQAADCALLAKEAHRRGINVWCYTGYTYAELRCIAQSRPEIEALLNEIDVLVDGPFLISQRSLGLTFKGSKNQRIIDMAKTRNAGKIVLWEEAIE